MDEDLLPLSSDDVFQFKCHKDVSCFNGCCRDLNQFLTPYDILRIKNRLGLSSSQLLETYTSCHIGPRTGFPVVSLRPKGEQLICPFVKEAGCSIYEDRPTSCRLYPLARVISRDRETGQVTEQFAIIKESFCYGHTQANNQKVRDWIIDQKLLEYIEANDLLMEIIYLKNLLRPGPLDRRTSYLFSLACYDIDRFRTYVDQGKLNGLWKKTEHIPISMMDDETLLKLSLEWIKSTLFKQG